MPLAAAYDGFTQVFSGIVEEQGTIVSVAEVDDLKMWDGTVGKGYVLKVEATVVMKTCEMGCSIAVNGASNTDIQHTQRPDAFPQESA
jgi:riboflavin synthase alpha subunit